jgi:PleD family two-component response regulator
MADPKAIRLLVVEDDAEDELLLREAIAEIVEAPNWPNWHTCEVIPAASLEEATEYLRQMSFSVILLNLSLPDSKTLLDTFCHVRALSRLAPILVLADDEDEALAHSLLREGAQDVLLKDQLECMPLARAIRYATERQRQIHALLAVSFFDQLTGLFNQRGFTAFAGHDVAVARQSGSPLVVAMLGLEGLGDRRDWGDVLRIRTAEVLRESLGETAVVARVEPDRFGICSFGLSEGGIESVVERLEWELRATRGRNRRVPVSIRVGCATLTPERTGALDELVAEAESRLAPKLAMLAP